MVECNWATMKVWYGLSENLELYILEVACLFMVWPVGQLGKVKVVWIFHFWVGGELVALVDLGQFLFCIWRRFMSAVLNYWDLARVEGITGSKKKWRWGLLQCGPGLRGWTIKLGTQDCLVRRKYLYWIWTLFYHGAIPSIGIAVYDLQGAAAGKVVAALPTMGLTSWGTRMRTW